MTSMPGVVSCVKEPNSIFPTQAVIISSSGTSLWHRPTGAVTGHVLWLGCQVQELGSFPSSGFWGKWEQPLPTAQLAMFALWDCCLQACAGLASCCAPPRGEAVTAPAEPPSPQGDQGGTGVASGNFLTPILAVTGSQEGRTKCPVHAGMLHPPTTEAVKAFAFNSKLIHRCASQQPNHNDSHTHKTVPCQRP